MSSNDKGVALRKKLCKWFETPLGRSLQAVEVHHLRSVLPNLYGTVGVQLGRVGKLDMMDACVAPAHILLGLTAEADGAVVQGQPEALPFDTKSVDVVVMPHTLDFSDNPHQVLREVNRILSPEGHVVILGFNPMSLWGLRKLFTWRRRSMPWSGHFFTLVRVKDWLRLLDFELTHGSMFFYRPPIQRETVMDRLYFMDKVGNRWWPMMAGGYLVVAKKRVLGVTPLPLNWKTKRAVGPAAAEPTARISVRSAWDGRLRRSPLPASSATARSSFQTRLYRPRPCGRPCVALPRQLFPTLLYLLHPWSRPASLQSCLSRQCGVCLPGGGSYIPVHRG